jgi:hypothetical protein
MVATNKVLVYSISSNLPVSPWPAKTIVSNSRLRPKKAKPVPLRARSRRVQAKTPSTIPNEPPAQVAAPQKRAPPKRRVPILKVGKRPRPATAARPMGTAPGPTPQTKAPLKNIGPESCPMVHAQGKKLMSPLACVNFHPFSSTLQKWETWVPVGCGTPWEWTTIKAAVEKRSPQIGNDRRINCPNRRGRGLPGQGRVRPHNLVGRIATLHAIHSVFPSPAATGMPDAKDPVSEKKN